MSRGPERAAQATALLATVLAVVVAAVRRAPADPFLPPPVAVEHVVVAAAATASPGAEPCLQRVAVAAVVDAACEAAAALAPGDALAARLVCWEAILLDPASHVATAGLDSPAEVALQRLLVAARSEAAAWPLLERATFVMTTVPLALRVRVARACAATAPEALLPDLLARAERLPEPELREALQAGVPAPTRPAAISGIESPD